MSRGQEIILLTGASGYVGGRLRRALEAGGRPLRCMARRPEYLRSRVAPGTEVVAGDVLDPDSLASALRGVHTAYYLIHSMASSRDYAENDRKGARVLRQGGPGRGSAPDHLPRRARPGRAAVPPSREPAGGRPHPPRVGHSDDRVPRLDRHRVRKSLVRAGARAGGEASGDGHAELGGHPHPADRHRGSRGLPGRGARPARRGERRLRDRRARPGVLRRPHAGVRQAPRAPAGDGPRAPADAEALEPLAGAGLAGLRPGGTRADRRSAERDGGSGRPRAPRFHRAASRDSRGARPRAGQRGPGIRRDALVRRALVPAGASRLGRSQVRLPPGGLSGGLGGLHRRRRRSAP